VAGAVPPCPRRSGLLAQKPQRNVDHEQQAPWPNREGVALRGRGLQARVLPKSLTSPHTAHAERKNKAKRVTTVGFEPTPSRAGALRQRLGPIGHTVMADASGNKTTEKRRCARKRQTDANANAVTGSEPTPLRTVGRSQRLRPLGQLCLEAGSGGLRARSRANLPVAAEARQPWDLSPRALGYSGA
jgi:hypothetical protein